MEPVMNKAVTGYLQQAREAQKAGNIDAAATNYNQALTLEPHNIDIHRR